MCFNNLIGLRDSCNDGTLPSDGMYLNTLGISRNFCESIINEDYSDVDVFVRDMISSASEQLRTDVFKHFTAKFNPKSIIDGARLGIYNEYPSLSNAIAGSSKGMQIRIWNDTTFAKLYISTLKTYFNHTGNVSILVYDLTQGKLLDTIVVASVAGQIVETTVNKIYRSESIDLNLAFIYDSTFASYQSGFEGFGCVSCNRGGTWRQNKYVYATGITIENADPKTQNNVDGLSDFGGLSIVYSLQCDYEKWFCQHANFFVSAVAYRTAYLINKYAKDFSENFTSSNMDIERLERRMQDLEYEYKARLDSGVKNLRAPNSDACFVCNKLVMSQTVLPS